MPKRIQRKRVKGWRMPENTVSVTRPGRYGNPFKIGEQFKNPFGDEIYLTVTRDNCISLFETYAKGRLAGNPDWLTPLRGKDLACFCKADVPCHADVLLRLANTPASHPARP
jgi:Domain of unknown function (DUF4326)